MYIQPLYGQLKIHTYVIESNQDLNFRLVTGLLNQSTLKCSKSYSNFGLCPIYLFGTTRKYIKIPTLLINLHDLFFCIHVYLVYTFMWYFGAQLCRLIKNGSSYRESTSEKYSVSKIRVATYLTKVNLPIRYSKNTHLCIST